MKTFVNTISPTKLELIEAIKNYEIMHMIIPDGILPEALKKDQEKPATIVHHIIQKIWEKEFVLTYWKLGQLVKLIL